jgi:hypothetical protein
MARLQGYVTEICLRADAWATLLGISGSYRRPVRQSLSKDGAHAPHLGERACETRGELLKLSGDNSRICQRELPHSPLFSPS